MARLDGNYWGSHQQFVNRLLWDGGAALIPGGLFMVGRHRARDHDAGAEGREEGKSA